MKTVTTRGPIGAALNAIRRELVRLKIQSSEDVVSDETPRGTTLSVPRVSSTSGSSTPTSPKYEPFVTEGTSTYFITPWHWGLCGPVIQVGDRQYRGFQLTGGPKVILATVKMQARAMRYPVGTQDPENPETPPTEFYSVLTDLVLSNQASGTFNGEQVGFSNFGTLPGVAVVNEVGGSFITQRWFFPVRLESSWDELNSRISSADVVASGTPTYSPQPGEQENPWDAKEYFNDYEMDVLVGFVQQETIGGAYSLELNDATLTAIGAVPQDTDIGGIYGGDQRFGFWHSEVQIIPVVSVPLCPPEEGFAPWLPYGFNLANRDAFGYPPGSDFPGKDETNLLRNDYPRQTAFMLPFGVIIQPTNPVASFRGETASYDLREEPPSCL
jgi:hypothetical protein